MLLLLNSYGLLCTECNGRIVYGIVIWCALHILSRVIIFSRMQIILPWNTKKKITDIFILIFFPLPVPSCSCLFSTHTQTHSLLHNFGLFSRFSFRAVPVVIVVPSHPMRHIFMLLSMLFSIFYFYFQHAINNKNAEEDQEKRETWKTPSTDLLFCFCCHHFILIFLISPFLFLSLSIVVPSIFFHFPSL